MAATPAQVRALLEEVKLVESATVGTPEQDAEDAKLDVYTRNQRDLASRLRELRSNIERQKAMEDASGRNQEQIRLKKSNHSDLQTANRLLKQMQEALEKDRDRTRRKKKDALSDEEIGTREEMLDLLKSELIDLKQMYEDRRKGGAEASTAGSKRSARDMRDAREARKKKLQEAQQAAAEAAGQKKRKGRWGKKDEPAADAAAGEAKPEQLSAQEQAFMERADDRDKVIDQKLDVIHGAVKAAGQLAVDMNTSLKQQDHMLNEIDTKIDKVGAKLETTNTRMKRLLAESGGMARWCPIMIMLVVLLALLGLIYQSLNG